MWYEITYDAYGVHTLHIPGEPNNSLAQGIKAFVGLLLTPQLYRGYVYSIVGEMYTYYLGSRYYVPQFCRFFNADKHSDTQTGVLATNMFAYCNNNPVMYIDPTGEALTMNKILELLSKFVNFIKNLFSVNTVTVGTKKEPVKLVDNVKDEVYSNSFWFEFVGAGAIEILVETSLTATITIYKKGIINKTLVTSNSSFFSYLISEYNNANTYLIHIKAANPINIQCIARTHRDVCCLKNGGVRWKIRSDSPKPLRNLYCMQKWYEPAESVGDIYTYVSSSKILEFQDLLFEKSIDAFDIAIQIAASQSDVTRLAKIIAKASSVFSDKLTLDGVQYLCEKIKTVGNYDGYSYKNGIVISEYLWISEELDESSVNTLYGVTNFEVEAWNGEFAYGEEGYCGEWIF